ncbi:MAG: putative toxin-antitoxin system toxin component, PIN family [Bacteroidales bacterium]|nr:putative toxin-antitoxin system toxin component, PIN family [Bacteroidales bacterium]
MADRIVLDTNSLIMAISSRNAYHEVWTSFLDGKYLLCISNEIIEEYVEVISRNINPLLGAAIAYTILASPNIIKVDPHFHFNLITADSDDNKFVDCAIASMARLIVTEDRHFNVLKDIPFPKVDVINIDEFLKILNR